MAPISDCEFRQCFGWSTERPVDQGTRESPPFFLRNERCHLILSSNSKQYTLQIKSESDYLNFNDFSITVCLDNHRTELILHDFSGQEYLSGSSQSKTIWKYTESQILKADPYYNFDVFMRFLILFDKGASLLKLECPKSVSVQTEEIHATGVSTQTSLYLNASSCLESLSQDFSKLLDEQSHPDVEFKCGDQMIRAHRIVLNTRSRVFAAMLRSDMAEGRTGHVDIQDMDPEFFQWFVRYLYTGKLPEFTNDIARRFYEAGDKYAVEGLTRRCADFLTQNLSESNACEMLVLADAHGDRIFKEDVISYLLDKYIPLQDDHWFSFCSGHPQLANEVLNRFCRMQKEILRSRE